MKDTNSRLVAQINFEFEIIFPADLKKYLNMAENIKQNRLSVRKCNGFQLRIKSLKKTKNQM